MHTLQPKHSKLNQKEVQELLERLNVSKSQFPKIYSSDPTIPEGSGIGDIIKIDRKGPDGEINTYYRVVV